MVHPTWHFTNLNLQVEGVSFAVDAAHSKRRRTGYTQARRAHLPS